MSYMLLIVEPPQQRRARTEAQGREAYARMQQFGEELRAQGKLRAVEWDASWRRAIVGSADTRFKNRAIAFGPSINPSSMLTSITFAPFST